VLGGKFQSDLIFDIARLIVLSFLVLDFRFIDPEVRDASRWWTVAISASFMSLNGWSGWITAILRPCLRQRVRHSSIARLLASPSLFSPRMKSFLMFLISGKKLIAPTLPTAHTGMRAIWSMAMYWRGRHARLDAFTDHQCLAIYLIKLDRSTSDDAEHAASALAAVIVEGNTMDRGNVVAVDRAERREQRRDIVGRASVFVARHGHCA
jgi:hypothetical protein